ncbi:MAG: SAM-dependent DNA methyltransferase [Gammaproteobacteria bacterium]|nr:SAM-dependent DNA methyltransferase [Gammaproteobacteria bacterium]MYG67881.1 SAM-dependent DNA methyltransferase [Gammaproteobacteria bacterium]
MDTEAVATLEARRAALQRDLDAGRDTAVRNRMGQFATPAGLAADIQRYALRTLGPNVDVRFIDPAFGTGSFYSALLGVFPRSRIRAAVGYEIDPHYGRPAKTLWRNTGLDIRLEDFTRSEPPGSGDKFNLVVCNPPYVRHHHIVNGEKTRLKQMTLDSCGMEITGLAGLYCYFLGLSHAWMAEGGLAGWLIPSEFMDVNYGRSVKRYLLDRVTLLHIHRFDPNDVQFSDALVSSAVVWFRNQPPGKDHEVLFSYGGTLEEPKLERRVPARTLRHDPKWTRYPAMDRPRSADGPVLGNFFRIKRGLATGNNRYFILDEQEIARRGLPMEAFKPILPSPRYLTEDEVRGDRRGNPVLERRLFLLDPPWGEEEIRERFPELWAYLAEGKENGIADRYICRHRKRWYTQENRPPAPFVCTYLGRSDTRTGRPFRFILNHSRATAANVYLMLYPSAPLEQALKARPELNRQVWKFLNEIPTQDMLGEGRVYGGGLHKLEPKELGNVPAEAIARLFSEADWPGHQEQTDLVGQAASLA